MRTLPIAFILMLIGIVGYAYDKDPADCVKLFDDFSAIFISLCPVKVETNSGTSNISTAPVSTDNSTNAAPEAASTTTTPAVSPPASPALPVNSLIQNGDFFDGDTYWQGDGKTPRAYAVGNPAALTDPLTSKGLIVTLNPTSWTRIYQTFPTGKGTQYSIVVTYKLSPNITLSKDAADYAVIGHRIQVPGFENFGSITSEPGEFYGTIGDPSSTSIDMEVYSPKLGSGEVQTYHHTYPPIPVSGSKTFALAFPPGTGTVVILSVAVTSN